METKLGCIVMQTTLHGVPQFTATIAEISLQPGFHLRRGAQGKLPPQTAQLPPKTDPTSPPRYYNYEVYPPLAVAVRPRDP